MARTSFLDRLRAGTMLADGAMGTLLYNRGISFDRSFEALNITDPELVRSVHRDHVAAGAELIETNTFGGNALRLAEHGLDDRVHEVNFAAARLAREVADAGGEVWVAGSVGPLGVPLAPIGALSTEKAQALFAEQIAALAEGGVDVIVIETMRYLTEALAAVDACRDVCDLPVAVLITFGEDELTAMGRRPEEVARALDSAGVDVVGTNCSTGPAMALDVATRMRAVTDLPLCAMPNAGLPTVSSGRYYYAASPVYMAEVALDMVSAGISLIGGCCGTTPEHISAMRRALHGKPHDAPRLAFPVSHQTSGPATATLRGPTAMELALRERFVVTVEVDPPRGFSFQELLPQLRHLRDSGYVDAIDVADNPRAQARMSALVMSALIHSQAGLDTVLHVGCRHRNLLAVHSDMLGAHALGVRNIFVVMGDLPANGDYPDATVNNDVTATGLMQLLQKFNSGVGLSTQVLTDPTEFHVGCAFNVGARDLDKELRLLDKKLASGARFALTQPVYDPRRVERVLARFDDGRFPMPLLVGVLPLWNDRHARFLHHEVPGIDVPADVLARMEVAGRNGRDVGVAVAREVLTALDGAVRGAYFMPPFGKYELVPEIMEGIREPLPTVNTAR